MRLTACLGMAMLMFIPAGGEAGACNSSTGRSISVHGSAVQRLRPDRVTFSVGVQSHAPTVAEAFNANAARSNAVIAALKRKGVTSDEIQTSGLNVTTFINHKGKPEGFQAENQVTVTRSDIKSIGDVLQAAVDAGANQIGGLRFSVADVSSVRRHGLELAFQDARARAETLAALSKRSLGGVVCVSDELVSPLESRVQAAGMMRGYAAAPNIEPGLEERAFGVTVVFELK